MMRRVGIGLVVACLFSTPALAKDIIACPGTLPSAALEKENLMPAAERLLRRFMAAFGLHGLKIDPIDEVAIIERYGEHPEQLLAKLTYLSLQCQLLFLESPGLGGQTKRDAVRRLFLDYVLSEPAGARADLAGYVSEAAQKANETPNEQEIAKIEEILAGSKRRQWRKTWYPNERRPRPEPPDRRAVIAASLCHEDEGWATLGLFQELWPDVHFELQGRMDDEGPPFAIITGRGLTLGSASILLEQIRGKGFPGDSCVSGIAGKDDGATFAGTICKRRHPLSKEALAALREQPVNAPESGSETASCDRIAGS